MESRERGAEEIWRWLEAMPLERARGIVADLRDRISVKAMRAELDHTHAVLPSWRAGGWHIVIARNSYGDLSPMELFLQRDMPRPVVVLPTRHNYRVVYAHFPISVIRKGFGGPPITHARDEPVAHYVGHGKEQSMCDFINQQLGRDVCTLEMVKEYFAYLHISQ